MRRDQLPDRPARLLPAGQRWGFGAHSVLPYLDMALNARPGQGDEGSTIRNPVFPQMESTLQQLRRH